MISLGNVADDDFALTFEYVRAVVRECYVRWFPERRKALWDVSTDDPVAHAAAISDSFQH